MKKIFVFLIAGLLLLSLVGVAYADNDENETDDAEGNLTRARVQKQDRTFEITDANQNRYNVTVTSQIRERNNQTYQKIKVRNIAADTDLELENITDGNQTRLRVKLSNGNNAEVKIMPDKASETALERLRAKNVTLELKEVGNTIVYEAEGNKEVKFLGLFKVQAKVRAQISAVNGEVVSEESPWWRFMATGWDE